jgi:hypothetical protein
MVGQQAGPGCKLHRVQRPHPYYSLAMKNLVLRLLANQLMGVFRFVAQISLQNMP